MARLAQWLVKKARQELDVPLETLEGELDWTDTHVLLASSRRGGGKRREFILLNTNSTTTGTLSCLPFTHNCGFYIHGLSSGLRNERKEHSS